MHCLPGLPCAELASSLGSMDVLVSGVPLLLVSASSAQPSTSSPSKEDRGSACIGLSRCTRGVGSCNFSLCSMQLGG